MKKRILSCLMALALCLTLLPTAALAEETEGTAQTPPAVEEAADPANGEAKQEKQPAEAKQENQSAAPEQESQSAEQEEQQEDSASKQDEAVAAVQAMIDALPDAAALDGMDDEDAMAVYEAFQTACDAYYETLTEGQQAQLKNTEKLEALSKWFSQSAALAEGTEHTDHSICGETGCTEHGGNVSDWKGVSSLNEINGAGYYYLTRAVQIDSTWEPESGVVLCLNGYSITANGKFNAITIQDGRTFTLCDCKSSGSTGKVTHSNGTGSGVYVNGTFNMYGGSISGNSAIYGGGVRIERTIKTPVFNMYGGEITNNKAASSGGFGGGVYVCDGTFKMSGGEITGNTATNTGGGVYAARRGSKITMSGNARIADNEVTDSDGKGGGVYVGTAVTFTMSGGSITGNKTSNGGGVYVNGTFTMSGGTIENNTATIYSGEAYGDGGGVYVNGGTFTMAGGGITNNTATSRFGGGVCVGENAAFTVSGNVAVTENLSSGAANDVYLYSGKSITIGSALDSKARIGVICAAIDSGKSVTVATGAAGSCTKDNFFADKGGEFGIKVEQGTDTNHVNVKLYNGLPHEHYRCNGKDAATGGDKCTGIGGHTEEGVLSFKAWKSTTQLPTTSGEYYLTKDVTLDSAWSIKGTGGEQVRFVLCLNGHSIRLKDGVNDYVINVGAGGTLALCDCDGSKGTITGSTKASGVYIDKAGAFVMYGGSISGNGNGVTNKELFQMYGGSITGNDRGVENLSGTFTMYDGSITGNRNTKYSYGKGGGVAVEGGAFDMHGGSITGNSVSGSVQSYGGGVFVDSDCRFTMDGGSITGNTAGDYGGGVYVDSSSTAFTVSGDVTISGNTAGSKTSSKTSNVYLESGKSITVGGKLTGRAESIGVTTANAPAENSYLTIANGVKYTLTEDDLKAFASDSTYGKQLNGNSVIFTNGDLHIHAVCGESCTHNGAHSNAVWKPLTYNAETQTLYYGGTAAPKESKGFYKLPAGNYYLTGNITVDNYIDITGDVNLCLNGKTLSTSLVNTTGQNIAFILVDQNRTLTLCDCDTMGAGTIQTENKLTYGVRTGASGKFAMYGGKITGVECGVYAADQFAMYGGKITGTKRGVYAPEQFAMYGGTITGNTVYGVRPGDTATMIVGGNAKIESNATNVDLCAATITIDESLTQDARIGVRLLPDDVPAGTAKKQFATGANSSDLNYGTIFSCDNGSKYVVSQDTDGKLHFALHQHSWTYELSTDGQTITAKCSKSGCPLTDQIGGSVTINKPAHTTYGDGKEAAATVTSTFDSSITAPATITYTKGSTSLEAAPTDAGTYRASITVGGKEASVEYSIRAQHIDIDDLGLRWADEADHLTYNGSKQTPDFTKLTVYDATMGSGPELSAADYDIACGEQMNQGTYELTITLKRNYSSVSGHTANWYIEPREVTLDWQNTENRTFGDDKTVTATAGNLVNDDAITVAVTGGAETAAGSHTATATGLTGDKAENYKLPAAVTKEYIIGKAAAKVITPPTAAELVYNGLSQRLAPVGGEASGGTLVYGYTENGEYSETTDLRGINAGKYELWYKVQGDGNHSDTAPVKLTAIIKPKTLTKDDLTYSGPITKVYDSSTNAPSGLTVSVKHDSLVGSDTLAVSGTLKYNSANVNEAKQIIFTPTAITTGNYALADTEVLTITGAAITKAKQATLPVTSTSATYGEDLALTADGGSGDGTVTYTVTDGTGKATIVDGSKLHPTKAGTVSVTATKSGGDNYEDVTSAAEEITIGRADYNGTASTTVNIVKGRSTVQIGTLTAADFFPEGQMPDGAKITAWSLTSPTTAILSAVSVGGGKLSYLSAKNIATASEESGSVTIATTNYKDITATLTFHPTDKLVQDGFKFENGSVTKTYGDEDFTLAATGEVEGSTVTYESSAPAVATVDGTGKVTIKGAGTAVITAKASATEEYAEAAATCTLTVGKKTVTVKAKDQSAYVGDKVPALSEDSYTVSGLVGEEKLTTQPTVKYVGADGSEITPEMTKTGEVRILAGGAAASDNYTIRYEDGKLTVSTRPSSGGGGSSRPSTHPVQAEVSKDPDGTVSLSKTNAAKGDKVTITVKPEQHYEVDEVIVRDSKGKQLTVKDNGDGTFTFEMPADKVTVEPTFSWVNPFADVADSAYYVDAVEWMLKREVTQGTTETTFGPNLNCTRAQIVTFLWRAAGSPAPKGTVSFADVSAGSYYAKAVAWAIENGITGGTGDGLFSPDAACTRAQSAAFLYRAAGSPAVNGSAGFSDVAADAYYAQAVAWAKEHGITDGIGGGLFGSANDCTRAQIAAFLWRLYAEK